MVRVAADLARIVPFDLCPEVPALGEAARHGGRFLDGPLYAPLVQFNALDRVGAGGLPVASLEAYPGPPREAAELVVVGEKRIDDRARDLVGAGSLRPGSLRRCHGP